jgi:hypothetical protein
MAPCLGRQAPVRLLLVFAVLCSSCMTLTGVQPCADEDDAGCADGACKYPFTKVCAKPTMHALAKDLDCLEEHIDKYGSVVAKQPDIWGQARLTKYRDEFEKEMFKEYTLFKDTLQGSLSRSDQAYVANAFALSAAAQAKASPAPPRPRFGFNVDVQQTTPAPSSGGSAPVATPNADAFSGFNSITRNPVPPPIALGFGAVGQAGTALEPTTHLNQKARYLEALNQIRRNNEGDDTVDSPGYSLNLVRIPISVLPGKCTERGHGAEVTITLKPYLSDDLLPTTFRQLAMNDVVDLLALPVAKIADLATAHATNMGKIATDTEERKAYYDLLESPLTEDRGDGSSLTVSPMRTAAKAAYSGNTSRTPSPRQRVALLPLPPSQLEDVVGWANLTAICRAIDKTIYDHQTAQNQVFVLDAQGALRDEVDAAYKLLSPSGRPDLWSFCTPDLVRAIREQRNDCVAAARCNFQASAGGANPLTVTTALAWVIIVESALLNDRLVQDMHEATSAKGCASPAAEAQPFFLPDPPAEARTAFNEYVHCRWPIHVFAMDPMEQDQNIADRYSSRNEMQLAMSLSFVSGGISAADMSRYARHLEKDMESIQINRTQVGFSHGDDTFGWRFYPRFQSPPFQSNLTVFFRDQLWGGPSKKAEMRQEWLEPGIRDSVALVMMPSFVPYLTCESSSNWFRLGDPKCKEFTTAEAVRLGRKLKGIYTCGPNVQNADCYRDGDLGRMMTKAKQLEARLPLQDTKVQVPYENTLGGFAMFNTGVTDLAPDLRGWYGGPGVSANADTQLFLVGDHFSVHQTQVIAGGKPVEFEMLSRQIMKVTIPKGTMANERPLEAPKDDKTGKLTSAVSFNLSATKCIDPCGNICRTISASGSAVPTPKTEMKYKYVDVHVATPYGVTAHLEIPVASEDAAAAASSGPTEKNTGLTWNPTNVEIPFCYGAGGILPVAPPLMRPPVAIKWDTKKLGTPLLNITSYDLKLAFSKPYGDAKVTYPNPFDETAGLVISGIPAANLTDPVTVSTAAAAPATYKLLFMPNDTLVGAVMGKFAGFFGPKNINPPVPVRLNKAVLVAKDAGGNVVSQTEMGNELTITWQDTTPCPPIPSEMWHQPCCPPPHCPPPHCPPPMTMINPIPAPPTTTPSPAQRPSKMPGEQPTSGPSLESQPSETPAATAPLGPPTPVSPLGP